MISCQFDLVWCDQMLSVKEILYRSLAFLNSLLSCRFLLQASWLFHWMLKKHPTFNMTHTGLFMLINTPHPHPAKKKKNPYFASIFLILANTSSVRQIAHTNYFRIILDSSIAFTYSSPCFTTWCGQTEMVVENVNHGPVVAHLYLRSAKILVMGGTGSLWITKMY